MRSEFPSFICSCTSSASTSAKQLASNLHLGGEEPAEGKPGSSDLPQDALPPPEAANEAAAASAEPQEKEKVRKNRNNKACRSEVSQGNPAPESSLHADGLDNPLPLLSKRNSFRQQYAKLPANLPMRSTACTIL